MPSSKRHDIRVLCQCPCCSHTLIIRIGLCKEKEVVSAANNKATKPEEVELPERLRTEAFREAWLGFCEMRVKTRKPMTGRAAQLLLKKFVTGEYAKVKPEEAIAMVDLSTERGWQGIFPIKENGAPSARPATLPPPSAAQIRMEIDRLKVEKKKLANKWYRAADSYDGGKPVLKGWITEEARVQYSEQSQTIKKLEARVSSMIQSGQ